MVARVLGGGPRWDELSAAAGELPAEERVELLYWRARSERDPAVLAEAARELDRAVIWSRRVSDMGCMLEPAPRGARPP
jgi:hypothetical protein